MPPSQHARGAVAARQRCGSRPVAGPARRHRSYPAVAPCEFAALLRLSPTAARVPVSESVDMPRVHSTDIGSYPPSDGGSNTGPSNSFEGPSTGVSASETNRETPLHSRGVSNATSVKSNDSHSVSQ